MTIVEIRESRVEGRNWSFGRRSYTGSRLSPRRIFDSTLDSRLPRGVTLIELMIAIMIIGILAAAVLGVAAVAGETAREAKTKSMISRLHTLLMEQYDTYASRRVKLNSNVLQSISDENASTAVKGRLKAEARLYALREMMLMEVPDRWSDVLLNSVDNGTLLPPVYLDVTNSNGRTELGNVYLRNFNRIKNAVNKITNTTNSAAQIRENQGAECLYMVIMNACGDGEARTLFPESSIGDTDGDGANEFLDGWGHPIEFLRWAPGFESDIQFNAAELDNPPSPTTAAQAWVAAGSADHDPFDLYRAQPAAFRLIPLIYSPGRDEEGGLYADATLVPWRPAASPLGFETNFNGPPPYVSPALNPYVKYARYLGTDAGEKTATDNINNHLISTR